MKKIKVLIIPIIIVLFFIIFLLPIPKFKPTSPSMAPRTHSYNGVVYEGSYENYYRIVDKAVNAKNPSICDEINFGQDQGDYSTSPAESRYFCRADYATQAADVEYCKTLDDKVKFVGTIIQKDKCLRDLATKFTSYGRFLIVFPRFFEDIITG